MSFVVQKYMKFVAASMKKDWIWNSQRRFSEKAEFELSLKEGEEEKVQ